jgi:hypothetical protein
MDEKRRCTDAHSSARIGGVSGLAGLDGWRADSLDSVPLQDIDMCSETSNTLPHKRQPTVIEYISIEHRLYTLHRSQPRSHLSTLRHDQYSNPMHAK